MNRTKALLALLLLAGSAPLAIAQPGPALKDTWAPNGPVNAVAVHGDTVYFAGDFTHLGPQVTDWVSTDLYTGEILTPLAPIAGTIQARTRDGAGGWYVSSYERKGADWKQLHILPDGTVDPGFQSSIPDVSTMRLRGNSLHLVASYEHVILDAQSGQLLPIPPIEGTILRSIGFTNDYFVYTEVCMNAWIVLDADTLDHVATYELGEMFSVGSLETNGNILYYSAINNCNGIPVTSFISGFNLETGEPLPWRIPCPTWSVSLAYLNGRLYVGGDFTNIAGMERQYLAALDAATGELLDWAPSLDGELGTMVATEHGVYVSGAFRRVNGVPRDFMARLDPDTGALYEWAPRLDSIPSFISVNDLGVILGGRFTTSPILPRNGLAAISISTGLPTDWRMDLAGASGYWVNPSLDIIENKLYIGGNFSSVGGVPRRNLAAVDLSTGELSDWNPGPIEPILDMEASENAIYLQGNFTEMNGIPREGFAVFDGRNGQLTDLDIDGPIQGFSVSEPYLYTKIERSFQKIDVNTGESLGWSYPSDTGYFSSFLVRDDYSFFSYYALEYKGWSAYYRNEIVCLRGEDFRWGLEFQYGSAPEMFKTGATLFACQYEKFSAIDMVTGVMRPWDTGLYGLVKDLRATPEFLVAGGSFDTDEIGVAPRLAIFPRDPVVATVTPVAQEKGSDSVAFTVSFDRAVRFFDRGLDVTVDHTGTAHTSLLLEAGENIYTVTVGGLRGQGSFALSVLPSSDVEDANWNVLKDVATSARVSIDNGVLEGEGEVSEGEGSTIEGEVPEGEGEIGEGEGHTTDGEGEAPEGEGGVTEGEAETPDGEGDTTEGEGAAPAAHAADVDGNLVIDLSEVLRVVQLRNAGGHGCDAGSEDGFSLNTGDRTCTPHTADSIEQDWVFSLSELLRVIQIYNAKGYTLCRENADGVCIG